MVTQSEFRMEQYRDDDHREDALHFTYGVKIPRIPKFNLTYHQE